MDEDETQPLSAIPMETPTRLASNESTDPETPVPAEMLRARYQCPKNPAAAPEPPSENAVPNQRDAEPPHSEAVPDALETAIEGAKAGPSHIAGAHGSRLDMSHFDSI